MGFKKGCIPWNKQKNIQKYCKQCNKKFIVTWNKNKNFCSQGCYHKFNEYIIEGYWTECNNCGILFKASNHIFNSSLLGEHIFCSNRCAKNFGRQIYFKVCENCGKTKQIKSSSLHSELHRTSHFLCSQKCKGEFNRKIYYLECEQCKKLYNPCRNCINMITRVSHNFCSKKCADDFKRIYENPIQAKRDREHIRRGFSDLWLFNIKTKIPEILDYTGHHDTNLFMIPIPRKMHLEIRGKTTIEHRNKVKNHWWYSFLGIDFILKENY